MNPTAELKPIKRRISLREGAEEVNHAKSPSPFFSDSIGSRAPGLVFGASQCDAHGVADPRGTDKNQALTCDTVKLVPIRKWPR